MIVRLVRNFSDEQEKIMNLEEQLKKYKPYNEQEECDKALMLSLLLTSPDIYTRKNQAAHITASSWLLNKTHDKVLMIYHNIYHSWAWTGGHADGETDLLAVAKREAVEETGVTNIQAVTEDIFSIEILTVDGHEKKGIYVPSHLHLNVTYLLETSEEEVLRVKPDENSGVKWFLLEEALKVSTEPWMIERIYKKLNDKLDQERDKNNKTSGNLITDEMIAHIGVLAKLELSEEEKEQAKKDLSKMLDYVNTLNEVDTTGVDPMFHVFPVHNVFREDIVENQDGSTATLLNAPRQRNGGFEVPKTIS